MFAGLNLKQNNHVIKKISNTKLIMSNSSINFLFNQSFPVMTYIPSDEDEDIPSSKPNIMKTPKQFKKLKGG